MWEPNKSQPLSIEARARLLFERIMLLVILLAIIHFAEDLAYDTPAIWLTDLLVVLTGGLSYYLHRKGYELTARSVAFILITGLIFYFAAGTHARNAIQWHFFSIIVLTLIIFSGRQRVAGIIMVAFVFTVLLFLELTNYNVNWFPEIGEAQRSPWSVVINIGSAVVILVYAIISLMQGSENYEARITQQVKDVQKLNKELDNFVYSASHDLKAPLSSLRGLIALANKETDPKMLELYLQKMEATISQSENFIKNITDYARNVRVNPKVEAIELEPFIQSLYNDLIFSSGQPTIALQLDLKTKVIHTDQGRLQAVFSNLLSNAIKYSDPEKNEQLIKVTADSDDQHYLITVADNGLGIDNEYVPYLFDMFYRASEQSTGSGLGLYIVKESLMRMGSSIEVVSEAKKGTTFRITIPKPASHLLPTLAALA
ncbi:MAG: HAMP domain-containing sensor histidine kinase [Cyclobacteriaceae bacterium]